MCLFHRCNLDCNVQYTGSEMTDIATRSDLKTINL